jgi:hypothetical protein
MSAVAAENGEVFRGVPQRGMARRYKPLTINGATVEAASSRLFGDAVALPAAASHRGELLRYLLRALYGADYVRRGAKLLDVSEGYLSRMMCTGRRVSRRRVQRVEAALQSRIRHRRGELRALAACVEAAFAAEHALLSDLDPVVAELNRMASKAVAATQPIDARSGRFVSRKNRKFPMLRDRPTAPCW